MGNAMRTVDPARRRFVAAVLSAWELAQTTSRRPSSPTRRRAPGSRACWVLRGWGSSAVPTVGWISVSGPTAVSPNRSQPPVLWRLPGDGCGAGLPGGSGVFAAATRPAENRRRHESPVYPGWKCRHERIPSLRLLIEMFAPYQVVTGFPTVPSPGSPDLVNLDRHFVCLDHRSPALVSARSRLIWLIEQCGWYLQSLAYQPHGFWSAQDAGARASLGRVKTPIWMPHYITIIRLLRWVCVLFASQRYLVR